MATNFPTSADSFTNPTASDTMATVSHAAQHTNVNDAVEAIETALLDGAPLHIDDANERVGIGLTNPGVELEVAGTAKVADLVVSSTATVSGQTSAGNGAVVAKSISTSSDAALNVTAPYAQLQLTDSDDSTYIHYSYSGGKVIHRYNDYTANAFFTLDGANQKIGVNTTTPTGRVHIYSETAGNGNDVNYLKMDRANTSTESAVNWATAGTNKWYLGTDNTGNDDLYLYSWAGSTYAWQVTSGGLIRSDQTMFLYELNTPQVYEFGGAVQDGVVSLSGLPTNTTWILANCFTTNNATDHYTMLLRGGGYPAAARGWVAPPGTQPSTQFTNFTASSAGMGMVLHNGDSDGYSPYYGAWAQLLIPMNKSRSLYYRFYGKNSSSSVAWGYVQVIAYAEGY